MDFGADCKRAISSVTVTGGWLEWCWEKGSGFAEVASCLEVDRCSRVFAVGTMSCCNGSSEPLLRGRVDSTDGGVGPGGGASKMLEPRSHDRCVFRLFFVIGSDELRT